MNGFSSQFGKRSYTIKANARLAPIFHDYCRLGDARWAFFPFALLLFSRAVQASGPVITMVSPIAPTPSQTVTITGTGFGTLNPFNGDSPYIRISDTTGNWNAGSTRDDPADFVTLNVISWTDTQITVAGWTGDYGDNNWTLNNGDKVDIQIWNAQTGAGSAQFILTVGGRITSIQIISRPVDPGPASQDPYHIRSLFGRHSYFLVTDYLGTNTTYAGAKTNINGTNFLIGAKDQQGYDITNNQPNLGESGTCGGGPLAPLESVCQTIQPPAGQTLEDIANELDADAQQYRPEGAYNVVTNNCNVWVLRRATRFGLDVSLPIGAVASYSDLPKYLPFVFIYVQDVGIESLSDQDITRLFYNFYGVNP